MIDYRNLFPPGAKTMYQVSQPLFMRAQAGKIYCKLSIPGDEEELCLLQHIADDWRRLFAEIGLDIDQKGQGRCILLDTLNYNLSLVDGFICPGFSQSERKVVGKIKLPMGYPELVTIE